MHIDARQIQAALSDRSGQSSDFDLNAGLSAITDRKLRAAAVLIGLLDTPSGARLILTKRASHLQHHPGQIALPGGKVDDFDADAVATALREAYEEIGLLPHKIHVLGCLPSHETMTGFRITPVIGHIKDDFIIIPQQDEVAEVFSVPLRHILDPGNYRIERRQWRGEWRHFYVVPFGPYYIWGATARILRILAERLTL